MTDTTLWSFLGANVQHSLLEATNEQDRAAVDAFAEICHLYKVSNTAGKGRALVAMSATLDAMQGETRRICRWVIARVLDWNEVDRVWKLVSERESGPDPLLESMLSDVLSKPAKKKRR